MSFDSNLKIKPKKSTAWTKINKIIDSKLNKYVNENDYCHSKSTIDYQNYLSKRIKTNQSDVKLMKIDSKEMDQSIEKKFG